VDEVSPFQHLCFTGLGRVREVDGYYELKIVRER
jgi:hypothetical protein